MYNKIVFFNHFHRGDLFTHKEFVRQIKEELTNIEFEYCHYNHPKVNKDLNIPLTGIPNTSYDQLFVSSEDTLYVNTWIGAYPDILNDCGGVNLQSLTRSWRSIFGVLNREFGTNLQIKELLDYLPRIDYSFFNISPIDSFLSTRIDFVWGLWRKRVLICNGVPMSMQSFISSLEEEIKEFAAKYPDIDFICTKKFTSSAPNIYFTDDITKDEDEYSYHAPWNDRPFNNCDLNEISYLSTKCDLIVGKNSGPFVFCETYDNLMDPKKRIISFSRGEKESMSNAINKKCQYRLVTDHSIENVKQVIEQELKNL
jgi:hypothetical protein